MSFTTITAETTVQQVRQHFRPLGLTLPAQLVADFEAADARISVTPTSALDVTELALAAQAEGRDPATDEAVRTALARLQLTQGHHAFAAAQRLIQEKRRAAALVKHAPALVEAMRPVVDAADEDLAKAREALGTDKLRLTDSTMVGTLSPSQLTPWATAREARTRVESVEQVWTYLAWATKLASPTAQTSGLIVADIEDPNAIAWVNRWGPGERVTDAVAVVDAGLPLSLATFEAFGQRVEVAQVRAEEREEQRRERQMQRAFPSTPGMVRVPQASL